MDEALLARTNAMVALTDQLAIVLGPVAAGVAIAAFGFRGAFVFDAITYAAGIAVLPLVRVRPAQAVAGTEVGDGGGDGEGATVRFRDTFEGWKLVARSRVLRRTVACTLTVHVLYGAALLSEPLYVRDVLHRQPTTFAALQTAFGVFLVLGGVVAARVGDRLATFGWVAVGVLASGRHRRRLPRHALGAGGYVGVMLWGLATALLAGPSRTVLQRSSPEPPTGGCWPPTSWPAAAASWSGSAWPACWWARSACSGRRCASVSASRSSPCSSSRPSAPRTGPVGWRAVGVPGPGGAFAAGTYR